MTYSDDNKRPSAELLIQTALQARQRDISTIPTNADKVPVIEWKSYKEQMPPWNELKRAFHFSFTKGIAVICGPISNNLQVIDVDTKNDIDGNLMKNFYQALKAVDNGLAERLVLARTRSGGFHLFFYCDTIDRSRPLARRYPTEQELFVNPHLKALILIETRAKGGLACIAPTDGYRFIRGSLDTIPAISAQERESILQAARNFNQVQEKEKIKRLPRTNIIDPAISPIDDYNKRGDVIALLEKHGWIKGDEDSEKTPFLRPGKTDKASSGNFNHKLNLFSTFSTSTDFEAEKGYTPARLFILLECQGDFDLGLKWLLEQGFGTSYKHQRETQRHHWKR